MISVKKYFRTCSDEYDSALAPSTALGFGDNGADFLDDEEGSAAAAYLSFVKQEASLLPFAIEATDLPASDRIHKAPKESTAPTLLDDRLSEAIVDYFRSVRELARMNSGEKREILIEIEPGDADCSVLAVADFASITMGFEEFAEFIEELDIETAIEWIFAYLVYLDFPLLQDTAAALQIVGRFCQSQIPGVSALLGSKLLVSAVVIREYFKQL